MTEQKNLVIDANIILRTILNDVPDQIAKVETLIKQAGAGDVLLLVPEPVLSDVVYVLYRLKVPNVDIADAVKRWLNLPGVEVLGIDITIIHTALDLFVEKVIKWSDALTAARMLEWGYTDICTFDSHFDRIPGLIRVKL